jgi:hypothetical protein
VLLNIVGHLGMMKQIVRLLLRKSDGTSPSNRLFSCVVFWSTRSNGQLSCVVFRSSRSNGQFSCVVFWSSRSIRYFSCLVFRRSRSNRQLSCVVFWSSRSNRQFSCVVFWRSRFKSRPRDRLSRQIQANAPIFPQVRPRPLPSTSFPIHYSPMSLTVGA